MLIRYIINRIINCFFLYEKYLIRMRRKALQKLVLRTRFFNTKLRNLVKYFYIKKKPVSYPLYILTNGSHAKNIYDIFFLDIPPIY